MKNKQYVRRLLTIILLTNIPAVLFLPMFFKVALGWILGATASSMNILWLAYNVNSSLDASPGKAKLKAVKGTYLRLFSLLIYSVVVLSFIKPNIISFGLGLLAGQMVIYLYELISRIRNREN